MQTCNNSLIHGHNQFSDNTAIFVSRMSALLLTLNESGNVPCTFPMTRLPSVKTGIAVSSQQVCQQDPLRIADSFCFYFIFPVSAFFCVLFTGLLCPASDHVSSKLQVQINILKYWMPQQLSQLSTSIHFFGVVFLKRNQRGLYIICESLVKKNKTRWQVRVMSFLEQCTFLSLNFIFGMFHSLDLFSCIDLLLPWPVIVSGCHLMLSFCLPSSSLIPVWFTLQ